MKNRFWIALCVVSAVIAGAAVPTAGDAQQRRERERRPLPPQGEPGLVAAADIAFAKAAREEGQWTAFASFAASGAKLHGEGGLIEAAPWLAEQANPPVPVQWTPSRVWSSCDGSLAVSFGRFEQPDGRVGSYATVWELQDNREYKWTYDMGGLDDPQPPPPPEEVEVTEDVIVVPALLSIDGKVAQCRRGDDPPAMPALFVGNADARSGGAMSRDSTLAWRWSHQSDGTRSLQVIYLRDGEWEQALDFVVPPAGE